MAKVDKLTPTQRAALGRMEPGVWYNPRELGVPLSTMKALRREGFVKTDIPFTHGFSFEGRFAK